MTSCRYVVSLGSTRLGPKRQTSFFGRHLRSQLWRPYIPKSGSLIASVSDISNLTMQTNYFTMWTMFSPSSSNYRRPYDPQVLQQLASQMAPNPGLLYLATLWSHSKAALREISSHDLREKECRVEFSRSVMKCFKEQKTNRKS